jgi:hypothetical protein
MPSGVTVDGDPAIVEDPAKGMVTEFRGSDGNLYQLVYESGKWVTWSPTAGHMPSGVTVAGDPAIVEDSAKGLVTEFRGSDGNLYQMTWTKEGGWVTWSPTAGQMPSGVTVAGDPAIVEDPAKGMVTEFRGSDGNLYQMVYEKEKWITWSPTSGDDITMGVN